MNKVGAVELIAIYQCFCDRTRLRILNVLNQGPLCVCHLEDILGETQVKVSKHLGYLKTHGLVSVKRVGNWRVYGLPPKPSLLLEANLACLQDCAQDDKIFRRDQVKLAGLLCSLGDESPLCCAGSPVPCSERKSAARRRPTRRVKGSRGRPAAALAR